MSLNTMIHSLYKAFIYAGYSRTASELQNLSDKNLADMGISRALLDQGANAYPWRIEFSAEDKENVTNLRFAKAEVEPLGSSYASKAA